jgi:HSP20 family protein
MFLVPMARSGSEFARSLDRLFDDNFFDRFVAPTRSDVPALRSPALDVSESEHNYTVKLDLPGVTKDDVKIAIDGRRVSVEAQSATSEEKKEGTRVVYSERSVASYARSFTLPMDIDQTESGAKLDNGVLTLTLAKRGNNKPSRLTVS